jgi:DNA (cytosine-5)-methyltransferase 1
VLYTIGGRSTQTSFFGQGPLVTRKMIIKAIDFFCGAGGLTRGLLDVGIQVLAGVDNDAGLRDTYERNNKPSQFICQDVSDLDILAIRKKFGITGRDLVLYAACTPCQPFSTLNQMKGEDKRKTLLLTFAAIVKESPPDFILVENVPGLNSVYGKEVYQRFSDLLKDCGFNNVSSGFLDAQFYGVPQVRKRFILLASRHGKIDLPKPNKRRIATVRQYIGGLAPIADGQEDKRVANHLSRKLQPHLKRIILAVPKDGGSRSDVQDISILLPCHRKNPHVHKDVFGRMSWDKPAPTLTCRCADIYCGRFSHPEQDRGISLREAASLQTFPRSYVFYGNFMHVQKQIGNAVPVKLATKLGKKVLEAALKTGE